MRALGLDGDMTSSQTLALYTGAILAGALAGGALPLFGGFRRSDLLLSFSAGVMLGAAFFHMLPEAVEARAARRRAVRARRLPRSSTCSSGSSSSTSAPSRARRALATAASAIGTRTSTARRTTCTSTATAPAAASTPWGSPRSSGCRLHTIVDGFALGAASVEAELGLLVFLAILAHKIPNAFSLSAILRAEGYSRAARARA